MTADDMLDRPVPFPRPDLAAVELDGETVVYDQVSQQLHLLDRVATVVWSCLDGTGTLRELATELAEAFGTQPAQVEADVTRLLNHLHDEGLLERGPTGEARD